MNKHFKKQAAYLLILLMMIVPLTSAFGQSFSCNMSDNTTTADAQPGTMMADHDCCEKPEKTLCLHCDECDCDHAQANFNLISLENDELIYPQLASFDSVTYTFQVFATFSSLYRPPRNFSK